MRKEMKPFGIIEGVDIPSHWAIRKFGSICSSVTDFVASGSFADLRDNVAYLSEPDYAMLVRTTDLAKTARSDGKVYISKESYDFLSNSNLFGGEIVLPNIGSIGDVYVVPQLYERMSLAPNAIMFKTEYCDKFFYYYYLSKVGNIQLEQISESTAVAKFNKTDLKQLRVIVPPYKEQKAIADFLDAKCAEIDEMISLQEKIIEELKAYKQSVITQAVTKGLNPDVPMKDSGIEWIGEIPQHWEMYRIKYNTFLTGRIGWQGLNSSDFIDEGYCLITGTDFDNKGGINWNTCYRISKERFDEDELLHIKNGDLLMTKDGTVGKMAYIKNLPEEASLNSHLLIIRQTTEQIDNEFLYWVMLSNVFKRFCSIYQSGSIMSSISQSTLGLFSCYCPTKSEQKAIADYLDKRCTEIDNLISIKLSKIDSLKEYKKSIIYEYVTGKKEVTE